MAPPPPCNRRAKTRKGRFGACAQRIEPAMKILIAKRNTVRVPKRSAIFPLAGMKMARLRRYDVSATLIEGAATSKSLAMVGKAVARIVASSCSISIALATMRAMIRKLLFASSDAFCSLVDVSVSWMIVMAASALQTRRPVFQNGQPKGSIICDDLFGINLRSGECVRNGYKLTQRIRAQLLAKTSER